jgi:L-alanine-DL-glutamate epimerase-like enolase superfamily enzyme
MTAVNSASSSGGGESLWPRLAQLPPVVEACDYDRLHAVQTYEFERVTTHVRLVGAGVDGLGEDVSVLHEDGTTLHEARPALPLEGEWTLAGFCEHLAALELWSTPPEWDVLLRCRNWAFESAALDLALRQAGRSLHDVLGLEPRPVRFVNSLGLGDVPSIEPLRRRLARSPGVRFKLDAEATWAPALVDEVAATGAVDTIDFKGHYGFEVKDPQALGALYDHVLAAFPHAYLEDPHDLPEIAQRLGDHLDRVSYDSPIHSAEDIGATPLAAHVVNVKPGRIGSLRSLLEVYARCERKRRPCTAVVWESWAWAADRSSCSRRCFTLTHPTMWRRVSTTRTTRRAACRAARWRPAPTPPASAGRRRSAPRSEPGEAYAAQPSGLGLLDHFERGGSLAAGVRWLVAGGLGRL